MATYNAMNFGATGDGVTDDRAAIQALLDQAGAEGGGTVFLPAGTYFLSNTLLVPSHVTLEGAGAGTVLRNGPGDLPGVNVAGAWHYGTIGLIGVTGASVLNLSIDLATNGTHANGIILAADGAGVRTAGALVEGVHIEGANNGTILIWNHLADGSVIRNNTLDGNAAGVASSQFGVEIAGGLGVTVQGNTLTDIGLQSIAAFDNGLASSAIGNLVVTGNTIVGSTQGVSIDVGSAAAGITVTGNQISGTTIAAINIVSAASGVVSQVLIDANTLVGVAGLGINLYGQGSTGWSDVTVHANVVNGVSGPGAHGINVVASHVTVDGNLLTNAGMPAIYVDTATTDVRLSDNEALSSGAAVPGVTLTLGAGTLNIAQPSTSITVAFSQPVVGFEADNLSLPAGVTSSPLVSIDGGLTWTGTLTAGSGVTVPSGAVAVNLAQAWVDAAGQPVSISASVPLSVDEQAPAVVSIDLTSGQLASTSAVGITVKFSEAVAQFDATDLTLPTGAHVSSAGLISSDGGITWSGSLIADASSVSHTGAVSVTAAYVDLGGNAGAGSLPAQNPQLTVRGVYDVTTWGATHNGVTDDLAAIQAALDAAGAAGGGTVYLPAGTYFLSNMLLVPSHVTIQGAGPGTVLRNPGGDLPGKNIGGINHYGTIGLIGVTDAAVRDLSIDHYTNATHANGIILGFDGAGTPTTYSLVEGVHIDGHNDHQYLIWNYNSDHNIIRNNTLDGHSVLGSFSEQEGIEIYGGHHVLVEGNTLVNIGSNALFAWEDTPSTSTELGDIRFIGNTVIGAGSGVKVHVETAASNITIAQNHISGTMSKGVFLVSSTTGVVTDTLIENNTITDAERLGIWVTSQGGSGWSGVVVRDNAVTDVAGTSGTGIEINAPNIVIDGNSVVGAASLGIHIARAPNASVFDNTVSQSGLLQINVEINNSPNSLLHDNEGVSTGAQVPSATIVLGAAFLDVPHPSTSITVSFAVRVIGFESDNLVLPAGVTASPLSSTDGGRTWTGTLTAAAGLLLPSATVGVNLDQAWVDSGGSPVTYFTTVPLAVATVPGVTVDGTSGDETLTGGYGADTLNGYGGNDTLSGLIGDDVLDGGAGNDSLYGNEGADLMTGGEGDDVFYVTDAGDQVFESAGGGTDTVMTTVSWTLAAGQAVEYVRVDTAAGRTVTGNELANSIEGNAGADTLNGADGNDVLSGAGGNDTLLGGAGADVLDGGTGADALSGGADNDTYYVDNAGDTIVEAAGGGSDVVYASTGYTLAAGQEIESLRANAGTTGLTLTGNAFANEIRGGGGNDQLFGGGANDTLYGGNGNDTLSGDAGDDSMYGGAGNDTYIVTDAGDQVFDAAGEGSDSVQTTASWTITAGQEIEYVHVNTTAGLNVTGNETANWLQGNVGDDRLDGGSGNDLLWGEAGNDTLLGGIGNDRLEGGAGIDDMAGGVGDDTYVVENASDKVTEAAGEGNDLVFTTVNWTIGAGQSVETLRALGTAGLILTGNALANTVQGAAGNDTLYGGGGNDTLVGGLGNDVLDGGTGLDSMTGGGGDDIYVVDDTGDTVGEAAGAGNDLVVTTVSWTLGAGQSVETLRVVGTAGLSLGGNDLANNIFGGAGNDVLSGGGGNDRLYAMGGTNQLYGGTGDDTYYLTDASDQVFEAFASGSDSVQTTVSWALTAGQYIEYVHVNSTAGLSLIGNELDNWLQGNVGDDTLDGGSGNDLLWAEAGNDILRGGIGNDRLEGGAGADDMAGGVGDDTYVVENPNDIVREAGGEGNDLVLATSNWAMGAGQSIETLRVLGSAGLTLTGNELANIVFGGTGDDILSGGEGNDRLYAMGGVNQLSGGAGNDTFYVTGTGDQVFEAVGGGYDTVQTTMSWTLTAGQEIEYVHVNSVTGLTITGNALDNWLQGNVGDDRLEGGDGNDVLWGEAGSDTLIGGIGNDRLEGGAGGDDMSGGVGDDTYVVESVDDIVRESEGEGYDLVLAAGNWQLGAGQHVELVRVTGTAGLNLTGNELANTLWGGVGNDVLSGGGGNDMLDGLGGVNQMWGGTGDDTFYVADAGDQVFEGAGEGYDSVFTTVSWTMTASQSIEYAQVITASSTSLTGNGLANWIVGNSGNDTLDGAGGDDHLVGGAGGDTFRYAAGSGQDVVTDFTVTGPQHDVLDLTAAGVPNWAALQGRITDTASGALITFDTGNSILLNGVTALDLGNNHTTAFIF